MALDERLELGWTSPAEAGKLWEAFTDPRHLAGWFADRAESQGAGLSLFWDEHFNLRADYELQVVEPGRRLIWTMNGRPDVEIDFRAGKSLRGLKLVQNGMPASDPVAYQSIRSGWLMALSLLRQYTERYWGNPKQTAIHFVRHEAGPEKMIQAYRPPLVEKWLPSTARVLQDTGSEVMLEWAEIEGALELKCFPSPKGTMVGLRAVSWGAAALEPRRPALGEAVERLMALLS